MLAGEPAYPAVRAVSTGDSDHIGGRSRDYLTMTLRRPGLSEA